MGRQTFLFIDGVTRVHRSAKFHYESAVSNLTVINTYIYILNIYILYYVYNNIMSAKPSEYLYDSVPSLTNRSSFRNVAHLAHYTQFNPRKWNLPFIAFPTYTQYTSSIYMCVFVWYAYKLSCVAISLIALPPPLSIQAYTPSSPAHYTTARISASGLMTFHNCQCIISVHVSCPRDVHVAAV